MKSSMFLPAILACFLTVPLMATEALNLEQETARINYSLGYQIGGDFKRQGVEMDAEAVVQGIRDALTGAEPQMSQAEMNKTLADLKRKVVADQRKRNVKRELELLKEGEEFMAANAKQEGVITTGSGLQYSVTEAGSGKRPGPEDRVTVHYRGTLLDGKVFDSSYKKDKPATFKLNAVIKGWSEGLQLMQEGAKYRLFIPPKLAYGGRGPLAHRTLIFDVELLKVGEPPQAAAKPDEAGPEKETQPAGTSEVEAEDTGPDEDDAQEAGPEEVTTEAVKPAEVESSEAVPAEVKPAEVESSEAVPAEVKPAEVESSEAVPVETKPAEVESSEAVPAEAKPADIKPEEAESSD